MVFLIHTELRCTDNHISDYPILHRELNICYKSYNIFLHQFKYTSHTRTGRRSPCTLHIQNVRSNKLFFYGTTAHFLVILFQLSGVSRQMNFYEARISVPSPTPKLDGGRRLSSGVALPTARMPQRKPSSSLICKITLTRISIYFSISRR